MTADSKIENEEGQRGKGSVYLTVGSHHIVRGRRLRVRRALGTGRTLRHCTKKNDGKMEEGGLGGGG